MWHYGWVSLIVRHHCTGHMSVFCFVIFYLGYVALRAGVSHPKTPPHRSYVCFLFLLKIHNWPVSNCVDLWPVFIINWLKRAFWLQTQARKSKLEVQKGPQGMEVFSKWSITFKSSRFTLDYLYNDWRSMTASLNTLQKILCSIFICLTSSSYLYQHLIDLRLNIK